MSENEFCLNRKHVEVLTDSLIKVFENLTTRYALTLPETTLAFGEAMYLAMETFLREEETEDSVKIKVE